MGVNKDLEWGVGAGVRGIRAGVWGWDLGENLRWGFDMGIWGANLIWAFQAVYVGYKKSA